MRSTESCTETESSYTSVEPIGQDLSGKTCEPLSEVGMPLSSRAGHTKVRNRSHVSVSSIVILKVDILVGLA